MTINELIKLMKGSINEITENENLRKVANIYEKMLNFNEQQKGRGPNTLTPKQMLQRLLIVLGQVKGGNTSENLLNKIRQIIHSLYQLK